MSKLALRLGFFLAITLLFFEILFRTPLLPASNMPFSTQDPVYFIPTYDATKTRDGLYTSGSLAQFRLKWRINNDGYMYARDFLPPETRNASCIAIIGDSYIEGLAISYRSHLATKLQDLVGDSFAVYPFGVAGAPLSEYEMIVRYVCEKYDPQIIIMFISKEGIEKSIRNYFYETRMLQNEVKQDSIQVCLPIFYPPNTYLRFLRNSAFARYIILNKELMLANFARYRRNVPALIPLPVMNEAKNQHFSQEVTNRIVRNLVKLAGTRKILFVVDADREAIYRDHNRPSPIQPYCYLQNACIGTPCELLDLTDNFCREYQHNHVRFSEGEDYHWSNYGHSIVANAVFEKLKQLDWLSNVQ